MSAEPGGGDNINVGNVTNAQGIAIGRDASATVSGSNITISTADSAELRSALGDLHDALGDAGLSRDDRIAAQTATGNAAEGVGDTDVDTEAVTSGLERVGETLRRANATVEQGSLLAESVARIAAVFGPLIGGARIVAGMFGIPI